MEALTFLGALGVCIGLAVLSVVLFWVMSILVWITEDMLDHRNGKDQKK
jgi:hypothetical protein